MGRPGHSVGAGAALLVEEGATAPPRPPERGPDGFQQLSGVLSEPAQIQTRALPSLAQASPAQSPRCCLWGHRGSLGWAEALGSSSGS